MEEEKKQQGEKWIPGQINRKLRIRKDGTPYTTGFTKGHKPFGNSIKGAKFLRNKEEAFVKNEFEKYIKKTVLKEKKDLIDALIKAAKSGNVPALKEVFDRVVGKAISPIEVSGKEGAPIEIMSFRDFKNKNEPTEEPKK